MPLPEQATNGAGTATATAGPENHALELPRRASRVELVGPMQGVAYADRKWLICLDGAQYVQATELLYHLLLHADGQTPVDAIAAQVTADTGRPVSGDEIRWLIVNKLAGSGLIEPASNGDHQTGRRPAERPHHRPGPAIKHRISLIARGALTPVTSVVRRLYAQPLLVLIVLAGAVINWWTFNLSDLRTSLVTLFFTLVAGLMYVQVRRSWAGRRRRRNPRRPAPQPSSPPVAAASAQVPTPLDGLGRPVPVRDGAAVQLALQRVQESRNAVARELAEELSRAYGRRIQQMAEEITRMGAWTDSVEQERERLRVQVRTLEAAVSELSTDMKRIAHELESAAAAAARSLDTARDRSEPPARAAR